MPIIELEMMVRDVKIRTLVSGDKQGEIVLRTLNQGDERALALLADKVTIKVTYEYEETSGDR